MKKTHLGKVTFVLTCICLALFVGVKILEVYGFGRGIGGFDNFSKFLTTAYGQGAQVRTLVLLANMSVIPVIWAAVGFFYVFAIGKNKPIKQALYLFSAVAVLAEFVLTVAGGNGYFLQLAIRAGFIVIFILFFLEFKKAGVRKWIYTAIGFTYTFVLVFITLRIINVIRVMEADNAFYAILVYMLLPVVFPVAGILVFGYILFPEKYKEA